MREFIDIVMDQRQYLGRLMDVAQELGYRNEVVRLAARLLDRVVDEDGVALVPAVALAELRVGGGDDGVVPQAGEALVALHAAVEVVGREAEALAAPDGDDALELPRRQQLAAHGVDVLCARAAPHDDPEGVDAVLHEAAGVRARHNVRRAAPARPVHHRAVEVDHHEHRPRRRQPHRRERRPQQVLRRRLRYAARLLARGHLLVPRLAGAVATPRPRLPVCDGALDAALHRWPLGYYRRIHGAIRQTSFF